MKTRLNKYKKRKSLSFFYNGENQSNINNILKLQKQNNKEETINDFIGSCKELIFDEQDDNYLFYGISCIFDMDNIAIELSNAFEITIDKNNEEEFRNILAIASMEEVPVYPNTNELSSVLEKFHRSMLINGFTAPSENGERIKLKLVHSIEKEMYNPEILNKLDYTKTYFPSDYLVIKTLISNEFSRLNNVKRLLGTLEIAISKLEILLNKDKRNENEIQKCLTNYPILFGTDYAKLIHKPKCGSEYELDYALQKYSGEYELIEIEASTHQLYTKQGNPSQHLVHAEQQVIDWLHWIERNHAYAREKFQGIISPIAYVIIGKYKDDNEKEKIKRRNAIYKGQIIILTYDDLILKAKNLLINLEKLSHE